MYPRKNDRHPVHASRQTCHVEEGDHGGDGRGGQNVRYGVGGRGTEVT